LRRHDLSSSIACSFSKVASPVDAVNNEKGPGFPEKSLALTIFPLPVLTGIQSWAHRIFLAMSEPDGVPAAAALL